MRIRKGIKPAGWILAVLLFCGAVRYVRLAENAAQVLEICLTGDLPDVKRAEEICKEETSCCFWREIAGEMVQCPDAGPGCEASVLIFWGNEELLVPGNGIFALQTGICLEEDIFDHLSLWIPKGEASGTVKEHFFLKYGLNGSGIDLQPLCDLVSNLCLLFPTAVFLRWYRQRKGKWKWILLILFCLIFGTFVQIPRELIPSRCSDFSFWTTQRKILRENWLAFFGNGMGERQLSAVSALYKSAACSLSAWILFCFNGSFL